MGGGFNAQLLALSCVTLAPMYLAFESVYSYDAFDKIAFLIFAPYILWQIKEGLPTLEYYKNYALGKTWPVTPKMIRTSLLTVGTAPPAAWSKTN